MLRTTSETPISAAIRGTLWSQFSMKRVRSSKSLSSSESSNAIAFSWSSERNPISSFRGSVHSTDSLPIMSILSSSYRVGNCGQRKPADSFELHLLDKPASKHSDHPLPSIFQPAQSAQVLYRKSALTSFRSTASSWQEDRLSRLTTG